MRRWPYEDMPVNVVVVGDAMLDVYDSDPAGMYPGGAANAACNLAALGARTKLVAATGKATGADLEAAGLLSDLLERWCVEADFVAVRDRRTTVKHTLHGGFRRDNESREPLPRLSALHLARKASQAVEEAEGVLLSDYGKGVLQTPEVVRGATEGYLSAAMLEAVVLDPSRRTPHALYRKADYATPNELEYGQLCLSVDFEPVTRLSPATQFVVTRGAGGAALVAPSGRFSLVRTRPVVAGDPVGAGDTFAAAFLMAKLARMGDVKVVQVANAAAGVVCRKPHTAVCTRAELAEELYRAS